MKNLFTFLVFILSLTLLSCGSDNGVDDPTNPENPENPTNTTLDISTSDLTFEAKGGQKEFTIYCNSDWTITNESAWCKTDVTKGNGNKTITVTANSYSELEDQNTNLTIKAGDKTKVLTVTQKYGNAIILTKDKFDVPQGGDTITIDVKSNIEYQVTIPVQFQSWIKETAKSRAVTTKSFNFIVSANENFDKRDGYIVVNGNSLKDTVYVYQGQKNQLILTEGTYNIPAEGKDITVELKTNIDYAITISSNATSWISQITTRAIRTDQLKFNISANTGSNNRSAKIVIKDKNSDLSDTIYITQAPQGTFAGDVVLKTIEEVKAFQKTGCKKINGNLTISGDIETLTNLENQLQEIEGSLIIEAPLASFDGLYELREIGKDFVMSKGNMRSMEGLNKLARINGSFKITSSLTSLDSFKGLESLTEIGGDFEINSSSDSYSLTSLASFEGLSKLARINGNFKIISSSSNSYSLTSLASFKGLESLTEIGGDFEINSSSSSSYYYYYSHSLTSLASFEGLSKLARINGNFKIISSSYSSYSSYSKSLTSLASFKGLESLTEIGGDFEINSSSSLTSLASFEGLSKLARINGNFKIISSSSNSYSLTSLASFKGLESLTEIGGDFEINSSSSLTSLASFEGLSKLARINGNFKITSSSSSSSSSLTSLASFKGLESLTEIGGDFYCWGKTMKSEGLKGLISIGKNFNIDLYDIDALGKLKSIGGDVEIKGYFKSLNLNNLETIQGYLTVKSCYSLNDITGLSRLKTAGNITFSNCSSLRDFCPLKTLLSNYQNTFLVTDCGYNPTKYQVLNGECSKQP